MGEATKELAMKVMESLVEKLYLSSAEFGRNGNLLDIVLIDKVTVLQAHINLLAKSFIDQEITLADLASINECDMADSEGKESLRMLKELVVWQHA